MDYGFGIIAETGAFSLTGQNIIFDTGFGMVLDPASFALTGQSFDFTKQMNISADPGTFVLAGQDALKGVSEAFATGAFTYTGHNVGLTVQRYFGVESGSYTYSFNNFEIRGWFTPVVAPEIWTLVG